MTAEERVQSWADRQKTRAWGQLDQARQLARLDAAGELSPDDRALIAHKAAMARLDSQMGVALQRIADLTRTA